MDETNDECENESHIKSWETYKILHKIRGNVQQKRAIARQRAAEQSSDASTVSIEMRLNQSDCQLNDLLNDGNELINNVRVANERREVQRRNNEEVKRQQLLTNLQNEATEATISFDAIHTLWSQLADVKDPQTLFDGLQFQEKRIQQLMQQKNEMIDELQDALRVANERFDCDQVKQEADIQCLIERIDEQIDVMKHTYDEHLELLHESIDGERITFKRYHSNKWQELHDERLECEQQRLQDMRTARHQHDQELMNIQRQHDELNRGTRIKLDADNDLLMCKVQKIKAETILKTEQLNYNHHVLQKRAEENVQVCNQQKCRLIKLRECQSALHRECATSKRIRSTEIERMTRELKHLHANCMELEQKSTLFAECNDRKFHNVWQMHEDNALEKVNNIANVDRLVHEQHLGEMNWIDGRTQIMRRDELKSLVMARQILSDQCKDDSKVLALQTNAITFKANENIVSTIFYSVTKQIVHQAQWLLDEKLDEVLEPITDENQRQLIHIDNVFSALGIIGIEGISKLREYMLPHAKCLKCGTDFSSLVQSDAGSTDACIHRYALERHTILVHLESFLSEMEQQHNSRKLTEPNRETQTIGTNTTISRLIDPKDIESFWRSFREYVSPENESLWNLIETGLQKYLMVLKRRQKRSVECDLLRRQNVELTHLLQQYSVI